MKDDKSVRSAADGAPRARARRRRTGGSGRAIGTFAVLGAPPFLLYTFAVLIPLALCVFYSLEDYNLLSSSGRFIGLDNYRELFSDSTFWHAYGFTLTITAFLIVISNAGGVALAVVLNRPSRTFHALRTVTFIPVILSGVVIAFLWSSILTDAGILNSLLHSLHLTSLQHSWLGTTRGAQLSVLIVSVWPMIGFATTIYMAALQGIPVELLEAAEVDGAGSIRRFRHVVWPLLRPALAVNSTIMLINGAKSYETSLILTGGGPNGATETGALQVLRIGFNENRSGYAAAIAMVILATIALLSVSGIALTRKADR
ncbi:carbohydrate ABC transporter permease [Streptomyces sp. NPDC101776]|uniref:carbohydrate ABC transporter permease n=1 Tax=Streptomyces sp. NPDC101776 TaxID=3366146 RepID=UPI0037F5EE5C